MYSAPLGAVKIKFLLCTLDCGGWMSLFWLILPTLIGVYLPLCPNKVLEITNS